MSRDTQSPNTQDPPPQGRARSPSAPITSTRPPSASIIGTRPQSAPHPGLGGFGETALPQACKTALPNSLPQRKKLPHEIPSWVRDGAVYFITINCTPRGRNQLAFPRIADAVEESILHRQEAGQWWIQLLLLMPDHLHGLVSFGFETPMRRVIADWKRYLARQNQIEWQRDFFDHRIRDDATLAEKWHYIRNNPLRKNLVGSPEDWPYQWHNGQPRIGRARSPSAPLIGVRTPPPPNTPLNIIHGGLGEAALPTFSRP